MKVLLIKKACTKHHKNNENNKPQTFSLMATVKSNPKTKKVLRSRRLQMFFKVSILNIHSKTTEFEPLFKNIFLTEQLHMATCQYQYNTVISR